MSSILSLPSQKALFQITGTNPTSWRSDVFRGASVAAFGAAEPVVLDRPLAMDAAAIRIRDNLAEVLPRKTAAHVVRGFFDRWAEGVAHAEHNNEDVVFVVAELDPRKFGTNNNWRCAVGPFEKLGQYLESLDKPLRRAVFIQLRDTLAELRERAANCGVDLSGGRFFVSPDHPMVAEVKDYWARWRTEHNVSGTRSKFPKMDKRQRHAIGELLKAV